MSDFNYQAYLKNNPLLKEEVKDQLITESQEVEEVELPSPTLTKTNSEVTNIKTMAQAMLDFFNQVKEKEPVDFEANANMKVVLDRLNKLAKTEEEAVDESQEIEETTEEIQEESPSSKMKVSELKAKIKEDIMSLLQEEEDEVEVEDEIEVDVEEPSIDTADAGLSQDEQDIQDSLKLAYDNAVAIGDQKLADQIGNSITFFTRTHVVER